MTIALVINICWGALMFALSYYLAMYNASKFYPETLPTMGVAIAGACLAFVGVVVRKPIIRIWLLWLSCAALALLLAPCWYALDYWSGGDDGGAFGWLFVMGGASLISSIVCSVTAAMGGVSYHKHSKKETGVIVAEQEIDTGVPPPAADTSGYAIASVVCGTAGFVIGPLISVVYGTTGFVIGPLIPAVLAIVFGVKARRTIARSAGRLKGKGLALAGMILGIVGLARYTVIVPLLILFQWLRMGFF